MFFYLLFLHCKKSSGGLYYVKQVKIKLKQQEFEIMQSVRLGIIGVNGRGRLWRFWHKPEEGVTVAAGADISPLELEKFKERCNKEAFVTTDYKEMIAREDLDGIVVATPDWLHADMVVNALEAGKFVYCEKPLATTIEDADRIIESSNRHPGKLMVGFNMRYMPFVKQMKEIADSGEIGEIKAVWVRHFVGMGSIYYYHDWHADKRNTGSLLLQKGSHDIDVVHFVTGHNTVRVAAFGSLDFFGGNRENTLECTKCPLDILEHLPPKPESAYFTALCSHL